MIESRKTNREKKSRTRATEIDITDIMKQNPEPKILVPVQAQGSMSLWYKDFLYVSHFKRKGISYWRCENHQKTYCESRVIIKDEQVFGVNSMHNHEVYKNLKDIEKRSASAAKVIYSMQSKN